MKLYELVSLGLAVASASACSQPSAEELLFVRKDESSSKSDPSQLFLDDALARLTPAERSDYERLGNLAGFLFTGQTRTCIVIVTLRGDVINDKPAPAFCYDKSTNKFVERL